MEKKGVEEDDDERGGDKLNDEQEADASAEVAGLTVHACENVHRRLTEGEDESEDCETCQRAFARDSRTSGAPRA